MPFFEKDYWFSYLMEGQENQHHPFWMTYREIYREGLTEREKGKIEDFDFVFMEKLPTESVATEERLAMLRSNLSAKAMRAALFIMLYRDFPVFQNSFQILDSWWILIMPWQPGGTHISGW